MAGFMFLLAITIRNFRLQALITLDFPRDVTPENVAIEVRWRMLQWGRVVRRSVASRKIRMETSVFKVSTQWNDRAAGNGGVFGRTKAYTKTRRSFSDRSSYEGLLIEQRSKVSFAYCIRSDLM